MMRGIGILSRRCYVTLYRGGRFNLTGRQFRMLVRRAIQRLLDGLKAQVDKVLWRRSGIANG